MVVLSIVTLGWSLVTPEPDLVLFWVMEIFIIFTMLFDVSVRILAQGPTMFFRYWANWCVCLFFCCSLCDVPGCSSTTNYLTVMGVREWCDRQAYPYIYIYTWHIYRYNESLRGSFFLVYRADMILTILCVGIVMMYTRGLVMRNGQEALFEEELGLVLTAIRTVVRTVRLFQQINRQRANTVSKVVLR